MTDQERLRELITKTKRPELDNLDRAWNAALEELEIELATLAAPTRSTPCEGCEKGWLLDEVVWRDVHRKPVEGGFVPYECRRAEARASAPGADLQQAIEAIEKLFGPELEDWGLDAIKGKLNPRESAMYELLRKAYQISHAFNTKHSCYHVHDDWRKLAASALGAALPSKYWQQALREHHRVRHDSPNFDTLCNCGLYWATLDDWIGHVQSVAMKMAADAASAPVERPAVAEHKCGLEDNDSGFCNVCGADNRELR